MAAFWRQLDLVPAMVPDVVTRADQLDVTLRNCGEGASDFEHIAVRIFSGVKGFKKNVYCSCETSFL